jgi:hypothetical protein
MSYAVATDCANVGLTYLHMDTASRQAYSFILFQFGEEYSETSLNRNLARLHSRCSDVEVFDHELAKLKELQVKGNLAQAH